jgi:DNA-binding transcriptional ArsR family regulator
MAEDPAGLATTLFALSDPLRRRVLQQIAEHPDATVTEICAAFAVSRFAIMRHLNVLEESGMISRRVAGRERRVALAETRFEQAVIDWLQAIRNGGTT